MGTGSVSVGISRARGNGTGASYDPTLQSAVLKFERCELTLVSVPEIQVSIKRVNQSKYGEKPGLMTHWKDPWDKTEFASSRPWMGPKRPEYLDSEFWG